MSNENLKDYNEDKSECNCGCEHDHEHNHEEGSCSCGCEDHADHEHEGLMIELEDENGKTVTCEIVDGFKFKENEYAVVEHPESDSVYLFKVVGEGDVGELVIPDDDEFDEVSKYYSSLED